jgi:hypothetical protein
LSRNTRGQQEISSEQRLKHENSKLKRQIGALRKQLSRIDVDRYEELRRIIDQQEAEDRSDCAETARDDIAKMWSCWSCTGGTLRIHTLERRDGMFYNRCCDNCGKATKFQRYIDKVKEDPHAETKQTMEGHKRDENSKGRP